MSSKERKGSTLLAERLCDPAQFSSVVLAQVRTYINGRDAASRPSFSSLYPLFESISLALGKMAQGMASTSGPAPSTVKMGGTIACVCLEALETMAADLDQCGKISLVELAKLRSNLCTRLVDLSLSDMADISLDIQVGYIYALLERQERIPLQAAKNNTRQISIASIIQRVCDLKDPPSTASKDATLLTLMITLLYNLLRSIGKRYIAGELKEDDVRRLCANGIRALPWLEAFREIDTAKCGKLGSLLVRNLDYQSRASYGDLFIPLQLKLLSTKIALLCSSPLPLSDILGQLRYTGETFERASKMDLRPLAHFYLAVLELFNGSGTNKSGVTKNGTALVSFATYLHTIARKSAIQELSLRAADLLASLSSTSRPSTVSTASQVLECLHHACLECIRGDAKGATVSLTILAESKVALKGMTEQLEVPLVALVELLTPSIPEDLPVALCATWRKVYRANAPSARSGHLLVKALLRDPRVSQRLFQEAFHIARRCDRYGYFVGKAMALTQHPARIGDVLNIAMAIDRDTAATSVVEGMDRLWERIGYTYQSREDWKMAKMAYGAGVGYMARFKSVSSILLKRRTRLLSKPSPEHACLLKDSLPGWEDLPVDMQMKILQAELCWLTEHSGDTLRNVIMKGLDYLHRLVKSVSDTSSAHLLDAHIRLELGDETRAIVSIEKIISSETMEDLPHHVALASAMQCLVEENEASARRGMDAWMVVFKSEVPFPDMPLLTVARTMKHLSLFVPLMSRCTGDYKMAIDLLSLALEFGHGKVTSDVLPEEDLAMLHVSLHGVQWISGEKEGALETLQKGIDRFGQTGIARHLLMVSRAHGELALGRQETCRETVEHTRSALRASTQKAIGSLIARDLDVLEAQLCLLQGEINTSLALSLRALQGLAQEGSGSLSLSASSIYYIKVIIMACTSVSLAYQRRGSARESGYWGRRGSKLADAKVRWVDVSVSFAMHLACGGAFLRRHEWEAGWREVEAARPCISQPHLTMARADGLVREGRGMEGLRCLDDLLTSIPPMLTTDAQEEGWVREALVQWGMTLSRVEKENGPVSQRAFGEKLGQVGLKEPGPRDYMTVFVMAHLRLRALCGGDHGAGSILRMLRDSTLSLGLVRIKRTPRVQQHRHESMSQTQGELRTILSGLEVVAQEAMEGMPSDVLRILGSDAGLASLLYSVSMGEMDGWWRGGGVGMMEMCKMPSLWRGMSPPTGEEGGGGWDVPGGWVVCSLSVDLEGECLYLNRMVGWQESYAKGAGGERNALVRLPLGGGRNRGSERMGMSFAEAKEELEAILRESGESLQMGRGEEGRGGVEVSRADRERWWVARRELDRRMERLVERMEEEWLGGFKGLLSTPMIPGGYDKFKGKLREFLSSILLAQEGGVGANDVEIELEDVLCSSLLSLSPGAKPAEVEDVLYFLLDAYAYHGYPVDYAGLDVGKRTEELLSILEMLPPAPSKEPAHVILLLDGHLQRFPWECMPSLLGRSVCRLPTSRMLERELGGGGSGGDRCRTSPVARFRHDKAYYILNPSRDLLHTEETFRGMLTGREGWEGVVGEEPPAGAVGGAMREGRVVLYFGHGGGEAYLTEGELRGGGCMAPVLLLGCSSGRLRDAGDYDPYGIAVDYLRAGCPALLGNLWDVTDRDIDRFTVEVMRATGLDAVGTEADEVMPLPEAVGQARSRCTLRYLVGAAPVVYGLPCWV